MKQRRAYETSEKAKLLNEPTSLCAQKKIEIQGYTNIHKYKI